MASIRKRIWKTDDGETFTYQVDYYDQFGKRRRKQFKKRKDADAFLVNARGEVVAGVHTPDSESITVSQAVDVWLAACQIGRDGNDPVEPHTLRVYRQHAELHIKPLIGEELISRLTTPRINSFRDQLLTGRSRSMAKRVLASFKAVLNEAQSRGLVAQNVARPVKINMAKRHKTEVDVPTKEEMRVLLATAEAWTHNTQEHTRRAWRRYHALLLTAVHSGMRASELRGLYWDHVDLRDGFIRVRQRADENGIIGSVKSGAGKRDIPVGSQLVQTLREWKLLCPQGRLVFPNWQGNVENYRNIHTRCWKKVCERAGLVGLFTFHSLRHFHASMLIASDATPKEIQVEMGHNSIQMTFDTYGHLFPDDEKKRSERAVAMERELSG
ncbi:MAG: site-specific integrase [Rhodospirillales bacterium]|jgi:integrase|nr:site-specific integrase [Rhodospirillales bacterium]MBT7779940.1 site-specific integrase [Rhodospirillales bacterium]